MRNKYTREFEIFVRENAPTMKKEELRQLVEKKFSLKISKDMFMKYLWRHKIKCIDYNDTKIRNITSKKPIGYEYTKDDGMILVKIDDYKWEYKQRIIYEQYHNVKLTNDDYIIFLNQDRTDFSIDNLKKISRRESSILANQKMFSKDKDLTELGIDVAKLMITLKESDK